MAHSVYCYNCWGDAERRQTFYTHISVVYVNMTPYQLGMNWSSWVFNRRRGTIWMLSSLLLSATRCTGISYRDQTITEPNALLWLGPALWRTRHWPLDFWTLDSVSRQRAETLEWTLKTDAWIWKQMADGKRRMWTGTDRNRETEEDRTCWCVFCCKQTSLTASSSLRFDSLTLEPQFAVWIRLHCLKRTVSVSETSLTKLHCGGSCPPTRWAHTHTITV